MKKKLLTCGSFCLILSILTFFLFFGEKKQSSPILHPSDILAEYSRQLAEVAPDSEEARLITQQIQKVKQKAAKTHKAAENAAPFFEALADIKTTPDGVTYPKNYKTKALAKARLLRGDLGKGLRKESADILPWMERGPGNVSGRVQGLVIDNSDPSGDTWFAATIGGGVWKTSNAGLTWEHKTPELTIYSTSSIAQSESNPDVFYVGTGMGYGRVVELVGNGIWKSTDHGEIWTQLRSTANGELLEAVNRIVVDPNDENVVLACSNDSFAHLYIKGGVRKSGIFKTIDGGQTWTQVYDPDLAFGGTTDNRVQQIIANPENFNTLYASVNEVGVIKSIDAGETWSVSANNFALPSDVGNPTSGGFGLAGISVRIELAISSTDTARVYAAVERPRGIGDLYMTKNAGASWALVNDRGNDPNWFNAFSQSGAAGAYTAGWFDNTIAVHPFNENVVFVGGVNMFRFDVNSANNTRVSTQISNWLINIGLPVVHSDQHDLKMIPVNESAGTFRIVNANDGGVAHSPDGGVSWTQIRGQNTSQFYAVDKKPKEDVYIGGMQDNNTYHSGQNPGPNSQWIRDIGGDGFETVWNKRDPNLVLASSQNGGYSRSTDGANTWTAIPAARASFSPFISKIAGSLIDPDLVFTIGFAGVNRSDDFGASWVLTPIQGNWIGYRPFDNIEMSLADPKVVWISSRLDVDPPSGTRGGIHVSTDGGLTFNEISRNFPVNVRESSGIGTHPFDSNTAYFLFSAPGVPKVLRTTNLGQTWEDISGFSGGSGSSTNNFPDVAVFNLLVMPFDTDIIWVGTEIGLFVSEDGGATWNLADNGLPTVSIFDMKIVDDQVVVATYGRGIWSVTLPELANYQLPEVPLTPRLNPLVQDFSRNGAVFIDIDLRSPYDSTKVFLDGQVFAEFGPNPTTTDTMLTFMPAQGGAIAMSVTSYKDQQQLNSAIRTFSAVALGEPVPSLIVDFNTGQFTNFIANGLTIATPAGFTDAAIHSPHPYPNGSEMTFLFTQPFILSTREISYDEIVIVEPGIAGITDHTNPNFFDFCVVEGSVDGINWLALAPGYDSRDDTNWLSTFTAGGPGTPALYKKRMITIPENLFSRGDKVFLRFRLLADPGLSAWGWAIDNLEIQPGATSVEPGEEVPTTFTLAQNYPNPFNPTTTINYTLPSASAVKITIYNIKGQKVRTLVDSKDQQAGAHSIEWDGRDEIGGSVSTGFYVYRLEAADLVLSRKMTFIK